jgi:hypothetical protein
LGADYARAKVKRSRFFKISIILDMANFVFKLPCFRDMHYYGSIRRSTEFVGFPGRAGTDELYFKLGIAGRVVSPFEGTSLFGIDRDWSNWILDHHHYIEGGFTWLFSHHHSQSGEEVADAMFQTVSVSAGYN